MFFLLFTIFLWVSRKSWLGQVIFNIPLLEKDPVHLVISEMGTSKVMQTRQ